MIKHDVQQGSVDWFILRAGIATASDFDQLLTPKFEIRTGQMPRSYLAAKVAEWWQDGPLPQFTSWDVEQGKILEDEAIPTYELEFGEKVERVGFITNDKKTAGCSPDGLLDGGGLEIKCLQPTHHVSCLLKGGLPDEFAAQVHGSMYITGLPWWKIYLYRRRFPCLLVTVFRDEEIQSRIAEALDAFLEKFEQAQNTLTRLNGGPPRRRPPTTVETPARETKVPFDLIP